MASTEVAQTLVLSPQQGAFFVLLSASCWRPAYWTTATGKPPYMASHRRSGRARGFVRSIVHVSTVMAFRNSSKEPAAIRLPNAVRSNTLVEFSRISQNLSFTTFSLPLHSIHTAPVPTFKQVLSYPGW